jgi:hypothetical protein
MFFSCVPIANFRRKCLKGRDMILLNHQVFIVSSLCQEALARIAEGVWLPMAPKNLVHHLVALQLLCHTDRPSAPGLLMTVCHWWSMHLCWQHGLRVPSSSPSHSQAQDKKWCCWPSQLSACIRTYSSQAPPKSSPSHYLFLGVGSIDTLQQSNVRSAKTHALRILFQGQKAPGRKQLETGNWDYLGK